MKDKLIKNLHYLIIFYGLFNCYTLYTDYEIQKVQLDEQVPIAESQLIKVKKKVAGIKKNEDKLKEYESKLTEVRSQIDQLKTKMPTEADRTSVLQELTNTAQELNLKDVTFNPVPRNDKGMYFINSISLSGKGTYLQFLILFEKVLSNRRFFNVENFQLSESPSGNSGRFIFVNVKADLQTFEYNEGYKEPEAVAPAPAAATTGGAEG